MKEDAFVLNEHELRYLLKLLSKEQIEAKRKLESAQKVYEGIEALLQRACNAYGEIQMERKRQDEECDRDWSTGLRNKTIGLSQ